MKFFRSIFLLSPLTSASAATLRYVPIMVLTRTMAFARFLLVAWLLGDRGTAEYGRYQISLEITNWGVPLILFGLADVAERYAAQFERSSQLRPFFSRHLKRLALIAAVVLLAGLAAAPILGRLAFGRSDSPYHSILILLALVNMAILAFYQWTASSLRGIRAFTAAAALETFAAILLLALSALAAVRGSALWLLVAYALSNAIPLAWYASALWLHTAPKPTDSVRGAFPSPQPVPALTTFARFSLLRLLLMMTFSLISIASVRWLAIYDPLENAAEYALPYRIAQLLQYVAITLWASNYAIATRAWAHGSKNRARATLLRTGKLGGALLLTAAACAVLTLPLIQSLVRPSYRYAIESMLPAMLAMFIWYGLLALLSMLSDLEEKPHRGVILWASAVALQIIFLFLLRGTDTSQHVALTASAAGIGLTAILIAPALLYRPGSSLAATLPLALLLLVPLAFFAPPAFVRLTAPLTTLLILALLYVTHLLIRPRDKRALNRRLRARTPPAP